jgi:hypothetical protein
LDPGAGKIVRFLREIGLSVQTGEIRGVTVLPGIRIASGGLLIDPARLEYPGDLLHEAGHLAVMPRDRRAAAEDDTGDDGGEELAAIAWSYAATLYLGLPPSVLFHEHGYRGGSQSLIENFTSGRFVGLPMLQWLVWLMRNSARVTLA